MGTKRLKVQHKQIVKGSSGYSETGCNDVYINSQGDENNVVPSEVSSGFDASVSGMDGNLGSVCLQEGKDQRPHHDGILSNLEDLGEALPDVSA